MDEKLRAALLAHDDPHERSEILRAALLVAKMPQLPWYDARISQRIEVARRFLAGNHPRVLARLELALSHLVVDPQFHLESRAAFLPSDALASLTAAIDRHSTDMHDEEMPMLGRLKINDLPAFEPARELAQRWVEDRTGLEVVPTYTMFVRYGAQGKLPVHLDSPDSHFTVGIRLGHASNWPITCSAVQTWPPDVDPQAWSGEALQNDLSLGWRTIDPEPNEAILFSASTQWHWRGPMPSGSDRPYDMLYCSFIAREGRYILSPEGWTEGLGIDELRPLATVYAL